MSDFDPYHIWFGIPETERPISKYRLLALADFELDREVISTAAERQTVYLRTLQSGEHAVLVAKLLNEVSRARVSLLNAEQKAEYDKQLRKQQALRRTESKEIWKRPTVIGISLLGVIGVLALVISFVFSGDADPVASNTADLISAEMAVETAAVEKAAAEKAAAVTAALDKGDWKAVLSLYPDNRGGLRMQAIAEKAAIEKAAVEKATAEKAAADKAAAEKAAADKAAADKAAMETAAEKAAVEKAALDAAKRKVAEEAKKKAEEILARAPVTNTIGMTLNKIPAGTFMMGSPETEEGREDDEPQHKVTITKPFYMQTTEVTQGQWQAVMGTEPWKGKSDVKEGANYPASYVSWNDAVAYSKKLSEAEGKTYRLPTEAEWEYACRAGADTTWSFGNDEKVLWHYAWYVKNAWDIDEKYAHQVELKNPNAFGLYDMHGNVWEWCQDYYGGDYYKSSPEQNPQGPARGSFRVLRGGSWDFISRFSRSAYRYRYVAVYRRSYFGFRLVRELD